MNYDTIKEEIKNIDITLPPPQEEPERQYYFIKKMGIKINIIII